MHLNNEWEGTTFFILKKYANIIVDIHVEIVDIVFAVVHCE